MQGGVNEGDAEEAPTPSAAPARAAAAMDFIPAAPSGGLGLGTSPRAVSPPPADPYQIPSAPSSTPFVPPPAVPGYSPPPPAAPQYHQPVPQPAPQPVPQPQYQPPVAQSRPSASYSSTAPPKSMSDPRAKDCVELCQFAVSALKHNDINLARERLQAALKLLD
jgi:hypothetical protein